MITRESVRGIYPVEPLGEVVQFLDHKRRPVKQSERVEGLYPYFGANGQQGTIDDYIFDEPLVLVAEDGGHFDAPERGIAYQIEGKTWVNNHAHVLRPNSKIDIRFLTRVLENYDVRPFISGTTRAKLTKGQASRIEIPLPPLEEQRRIAAILDRADALRHLRRRALDRLNTLGQAIFHEMFGDPVRNPQDWPIYKIGEAVEKISDGPFGSNLKSSHYVDEGVRVWRLQNIGIGEFIDKDRVHISNDHFKTLNKHCCLPGDVIVGTLGEPNLRACIQPDWLPIALNKADCIQIRPDRSVALAVYWQGLLNHPSTLVIAQRAVLGQTRARISMGRLRVLEVPVPPIELQAEFEKRISLVRTMKFDLMRSKSNEFLLFASLQHRAFRGEL